MVPGYSVPEPADQWGKIPVGEEVGHLLSYRMKYPCLEPVVPAAGLPVAQLEGETCSA